MSLWSLVMDGGYIMLPLALLLLLTVYVFTERCVVIGRATREDHTFMNRIRDYVREGDIESAERLCRNTATPYSRLILKGLQRIGRPTQDVLTAIENTGNIEVSNLGKAVGRYLSGACHYCGRSGGRHNSPFCLQLSRRPHPESHDRYGGQVYGIHGSSQRTHLLMALKRQFPTLDTFSMSSMTDVIFLLLIFFMVTSTLIQPSAVDVNLPESGEQTQLKPQTEVYVDSVAGLWLVEDRNDSTGTASIARPMVKEKLASELRRLQAADSTRTVALYADERVGYGHVMEILDIAATERLRMVLATKGRSLPAERGDK